MIAMSFSPAVRGEVGEVFAVDLRADPVAEEPAADAEHDPGEQVEADQPSPQRRGGDIDPGDVPAAGGAHPALLCGFGEVGLRVGREVARRGRVLEALSRDPGRERRARHDLPAVVHVPVPDPAELGAADLERQRPPGRDVGDVVDARVGVGLDPELIRPEGVDHVERGDVELDQRVGRKLDFARLDAAEGGPAVRELPLLGDHLHLQRARGVRRKRDRFRSLAAAGTGFEQPDDPVPGERERHRSRRDDPPELHARVAAKRGAVRLQLRFALAEGPQGIGDEHEHAQRDRRRGREQHRVVHDLARGFVGPVPRRQVGPEDEDDDRRHDRAREQPQQGDVAHVVTRAPLPRAAVPAHTTLRKPPM